MKNPADEVFLELEKAVRPFEIDELLVEYETYVQKSIPSYKIKFYQQAFNQYTKYISMCKGALTHELSKSDADQDKEEIKKMQKEIDQDTLGLKKIRTLFNAADSELRRIQESINKDKKEKKERADNKDKGPPKIIVNKEEFIKLIMSVKDTTEIEIAEEYKDFVYGIGLLVERESKLFIKIQFSTFIQDYERISENKVFLGSVKRKNT